MKWNNLKPDISATSINDTAKNMSFIDVCNLFKRTQTNPFIVLQDKARVKIMHHLNSKNIELGGLLIGSVVSANDLNSKIFYVIVKDIVSSKDCDSTSISLTMRSSLWQDANKITDEKTFVVGWYHSHPDLGAFFSGVDRTTQRNFFNSAYSLGLVVDPIRNEEKWFIGRDAVEVNLANIKSN